MFIIFWIVIEVLEVIREIAILLDLTSDQKLENLDYYISLFLLPSLITLNIIMGLLYA